MATTKLWKITQRLDHVLNYAGDKEKTENIVYLENDLQELRDVMDYTCQDYKTEKQHYVSGINCDFETARQEMIATKKQYQKTGGIIAFHAYQSFVPNEITPELAHEVGMKLAEEMWGERFEVVVATHLDKKCIHNHFVLNSVSFKDGKKYYSNLENTDRFRIKSDRICDEYNLSVIRNPQRGRRPSYDVYLAEQQGKPTYRSLVRADIDKAIAQSLTDKQFFANLKKMGYEIKIGKDITVKPYGKERGLKLFRNFGENYTRESINRRILSHGMPRKSKPQPEPTKYQYPIKVNIKNRHENHISKFSLDFLLTFKLDIGIRKMKFKGSIHTAHRMTGFRALYIRYFYMLSGKTQWQLPAEQRPLTSKQIHFIFREDIRKMDKLKNEMKLLGENRIDSTEQLFSYKENQTEHIQNLTEQRQSLRYKLRKTQDEKDITTIKAEISDLSAQLKGLRREVKLCDSIQTRTAEMREKIKLASEIRTKKQKQITNYKEQIINF